MVQHHFAGHIVRLSRRQLLKSTQPSLSTRRALIAMATQKTSHMERTAKEPRDNNLHPVRISHIEQVNDRIRLFRLDLIAGPTEFLAGQWLDTFVPGVDKAGGFTLTCPPSTAAAPSTQPHLELAVQKSPENPPAAWLWRPESEILGKMLRVRIGGSFVFPPAASDDDLDDLDPVRRLVLVAGGVGVNPLVSMLCHLAETPSLAGGMEVEMVYASKAPGGDEALSREVVFLDRITRALGEARVRGSLSLYVTGRGSSGTPVDEADRVLTMNGAPVRVFSRRVSIDDVKRLISRGEGGVQSSLVYICGPAAMTDEFAEALIAGDGLAMDRRRVRTERWW